MHDAKHRIVHVAEAAAAQLVAQQHVADWQPEWHVVKERVMTRFTTARANAEELLPGGFCGLRVMAAAAPPYGNVAAAVAQRTSGGQGTPSLNAAWATDLWLRLEWQCRLGEGRGCTSRHEISHDEAFTSVSLYMRERFREMFKQRVWQVAEKEQTIQSLRAPTSRCSRHRFVR